MNHPCNDYTCPEWCHGQCFGGGCRTNPMPKDNDNNTQEDKDNE